MADSKSILLTFLRQGNEEEIINQLRGLSEDQWEALLAIARRHKLGPILFYSLKPYYSSPHIPTHYKDRMRNEYFNSAKRNMRLYSQLEDILKKFAKEEIPVILLKGAHLAKYIYGNIALRPMADIDLLVSHDDSEIVHRFLLKNGYSTTENIFDEELPPYEKKGKITLEIHSHLKAIPNKEYVEINAFWARAEKVNLGELETLTLCPEDLILHLCLHSGIQHCFENGLISCFDINHIVKYYDGKINWDQLWERGYNLGVERAVFLMLGLTEKMIGLPIPEQFNQTIKYDHETQSAIAEAEELLFEQSTDLSPNLAFLFGNKAWRKKYDILLQRVFLSEEIDNNIDKQGKARNNILKIYLLYSARIWILFKRYQKTIWLAIRKDPHTLNTINNRNRRQSLRKWLKHFEEV